MDYCTTPPVMPDPPAPQPPLADDDALRWFYGGTAPPEPVDDPVRGH